MNLSEIPQDVIIELCDLEFGTRTHGTRACYAKGCRGPLCRKAERDRQAVRRKLAAEAAGREYSPYGPHPIRDRDELLERVLVWHRESRGLAEEEDEMEATA